MLGGSLTGRQRSPEPDAGGGGDHASRSAKTIDAHNSRVVQVAAAPLREPQSAYSEASPATTPAYRSSEPQGAFGLPWGGGTAIVIAAGGMRSGISIATSESNPGEGNPENCAC